MYRTLTAVWGAIVAVALMIAAIWLWLHVPQVLGLWNVNSEPSAVWAVRLVSIGIGAAAQVVLLSITVSSIYRRDLFGEILKFTAAVVLTLSLIGAVVLGMTGR